MRQIINVILEGKELELPEPLEVNMNYTLEDYTNPTIIKVGYSKTIVVKGTPNNNRVFGDIWNLERLQAYSKAQLDGRFFNPSKRASMQIYHNGDLIEDGYCKLDTIDIKGKEITYNLTFYASLADFFYSMTTREDGESMTLADLDYGTDISFNITRQVVNAAWNNLGTKTDSKYQTINFAPAYNGKPQGMSADKALVYVGSSNTFASTVDGFGNTNGYVIAELDGEHTEWEMRDLRSYQQRPILRVKSFFEALVRKANELGFNLKLSKKFFNEDNPYYNDAWITLPMLPTLDNIGGESYESKTGNPLVVFGSGADLSLPVSTIKDSSYIPMRVVDNKYYLTPSNSVPYGYFDINVPIKVRITSEEAKNANRNKVYLAAAQRRTVYYEWTNSFEGGYEEVPYIPEGIDPEYVMTETITDRYVGAIAVQLVAKDINGNLIGTSPVHIITNRVVDTSYTGNIWRNYTPVGNASIVYDFGGFNNTGSNTYEFENPINLQIEKLPKKSTEVCFNVIITKIQQSFYQTNNKCFVQTSSNNPIFSYAADYGVACLAGTVSFTEHNQISSGTKITKNKLLQSNFTPCDYMLSYTKMFGLYWYKDVYDGVIHLLTRNEFFEGDIVDMTDRIDYSKDVKITPITFKNKYYDLQNEYPESELVDKYDKDYGITFGRQRINTNYNFDSDINDIYKDNAFKGAIQGEEKRTLFRTFKNKNGVTVPSTLYGGMKLTYVKGEDTKDVDYKLNGGSYVNWNRRDGYDCFSKVCFNDNEDGNLEGKDVLIFYNGKITPRDVNNNAIPYYLSDDVNEMFALNDGSACWLLKENSTSNIINRSNIPQFGRYKTEGNDVSYSFDFGTPRETFAYDYNLNDYNNIYTRYWKDFYNDQLDVNTRVMECYVLLDRKVLGDMLRKFYVIGNSYWVLNKINDYCITSYNTTKCEFIKICDMDNYRSQILSYTPSIFNVIKLTTNAVIDGLDVVEEEKQYNATISLTDRYNKLLIYVSMKNEDGEDIILSERDYTLIKNTDGTYTLSIPKATGDITITATGQLGDFLFVDGPIVDEELVDEIPYEEMLGRCYFDVSTDDPNWTATINDSWILHNYRVKDEYWFDVEENPLYERRVGTITFKAGSNEVVVNVIQQAKPKSLNVSPASMVLDVNGTPQGAYISYLGRKAGETVSITSSSSFCSVSVPIWTKDNIENGMFYISCTPNPNNMPRRATITITTLGGLKKTIQISQTARTEAAFYFDSNGKLRCEISNSDVSQICLLYKVRGDNDWYYGYAPSSGSFSASTRYSVGGLHMGDGYSYASSITVNRIKYYLSRTLSADWLAKVQSSGGLAPFNWYD